MSGAEIPTFTLGGAHEAALAPLIRALGVVTTEASVLDRTPVLIGGLAVVVRVATADRATICGDTTTTTLVAVPAALVAMKLHAAQYRRNAEKVGTDLFDLYRLLTVCDLVSIHAQFHERAHLWQLVSEALRRLFIDAATRSAGRMSAVVRAAGGSVTTTDLQAVAELFLALDTR